MAIAATRATMAPGPNSLVFRWQAQFGDPHEPVFFLLCEMVLTPLSSHGRRRNASVRQGRESASRRRAKTMRPRIGWTRSRHDQVLRRRQFRRVCENRQVQTGREDCRRLEGGSKGGSQHRMNADRPCLALFWSVDASSRSLSDLCEAAGARRFHRHGASGCIRWRLGNGWANARNSAKAHLRDEQHHCQHQASNLCHLSKPYAPKMKWVSLRPTHILGSCLDFGGKSGGLQVGDFADSGINFRTPPAKAGGVYGALVVDLDPIRSQGRGGRIERSVDLEIGPR